MVRVVQLDILEFHILQCRYLIYFNNNDDNNDHTENNNNRTMISNTTQTATKNNTTLLMHIKKNQGDTCVALYVIYILQRGNFALCQLWSRQKN